MQVPDATRRQSCLNILNWDVLVHMVTFLPRQDLSRLMKTCRAFHAVALREFLHDPIELRADNILSFYACIQGGQDFQRALFLRELVVSCSLSRPRYRSHDRTERGDCEQMAQLLTHILQNARLLKKLRLDWAAAGYSRYLHEASPTLVSLEELTIPFVSQSLWDDLEQLHAPLRRICAQFGPMLGSPVVDPLPLLERFQATLQDVDLSGVQFCDGSTQYPAVRRLSLSDCYSDFLLGGVDVAPLRRSFPNISELSFSAARVHPEAIQWLDGRSCDKPELIERCRRSNKHWQAQHGGWTHLKRVSVGHVVDLYMLGLEQHIPDVEIAMVSEGTLRMVQDVLNDTLPSSLSISLFALDRILDCIPRLFSPTESTRSLSRFALTLRCTKPVINIDKVIANVSALLAPLRVEHLVLCLRRWDTVGMYFLSVDDLRPIDISLVHIYGRADSIVKDFARNVPTLRTVTLIIGREVVERHFCVGDSKSC
ncbi:hypothetical protein C8Q73DRAFT_259725 [Cubamyces lactineus]|nr:hypothetical protein C8Q73DRAFT_259725 [Cubamyces lactineus]